MPRVAFAPPVDQLAVTAFPSLAGISSHGAVSTRAVFASAEHVLHLQVHELAAGAGLNTSGSPVDHTLYVWKGGVVANGSALAEESAIIVEHNGGAAIVAASGGATLLHFYRPETHPGRPTRAGGHVHLVGPDGAIKPPAGARMRIWADAQCPTCEIWLHRTRPFAPNDGGGAHSHSADEIEFILEGAAIHGRRAFPPGAAYLVEADTQYKVGSGPEGLSMLVFRPSDNYYSPAARPGAEPEPPTLNSATLRRLLEQNIPAPPAR